MPKLRLIPAGPAPAGKSGEVFSCVYSADGRFVLSGGWDGYLRLWDAQSGTQITAIKAGDKPISACAISPDGKTWLSGSLQGMLATWDPETQRQLSTFLAHTRPISMIVYAPDGQLLATASWDSNATLWTEDRNRTARFLSGHSDIVAGCRFTPDGRLLLSWSYDNTLQLWEVARARSIHTFRGHGDRVTAGAISPDGKWIASGSRDGGLKIWDLHNQTEAGYGRMPSEIRACLFLLDAESLVAIDAHGRAAVYRVPDFSEMTHLKTRIGTQCAALAPTGDQIAMGGEDGQIYLLAVDEIENLPLTVTATHVSRRTSTRIQRFFGRSQLTHAYTCTCPACRQSFELPKAAPGLSAPCPYCTRTLRLSTITPGGF